MRFFRFGRKWPEVFQLLQLPQSSSASFEQQLETERGKTRAAIAALEQAQRQLSEYKRRAEKRQAEAQIAGVITACSQLITSIDDMSRAFEIIPDELHGHAWVQGMYLATMEFAKTLRSLGMVRFTMPNDPQRVFNPLRYHAIGTEFRPDLAEGTILRIIQPGYLFRFRTGENEAVVERLIRPAQCIVSTQVPS